MHRIKCPWCGVRDEVEFRYRGDARPVRPAADAGADAFYDFVYTRDNIKGWQVEWGYHVGGCRQWIKVVRNTLTHEIRRTGTATERVEVETP